jgi:zinc transport system substrate-binding protein
MHWEPEEMPGEAQWDNLKELLKQHPAKWMIWEAPPKGEIIEKLKGHGLGCVVFYSCGNVPQEGDYLTVMQRNIERLKPISQAP